MIKPYYQDDRVTIYNGDCLEVMKEFPDNYFDLVLTDPPYGIGENNKQNLSRGKWAAPKDYVYYDWDFNKVSDDYFIEIKRISKVDGC